MNELSVRHDAGDRFTIFVRGHEVVVDQPATGDSAPTPTELFVASLASCVAFFARRFLSRHGVADGELSVGCEFEWSADHSRVAGVGIRVQLDRPLDDDLRTALQRVVEHCTVHQSILTPPAMSMTIASATEAASSSPAQPATIGGR